MFRWIKKTDTLGIMHEEMKARRYQSEDREHTQAVTSQVVPSDQPRSKDSNIERSKIPATMTFHPVLLQEHRDGMFRHAIMGSNGAVRSNNLLTSQLLKRPAKRNQALPIERLVGLSGILHHEVRCNNYMMKLSP